MTSSGSVTALLLAGGSGERLGGEIPKQFVDVAGEPMFVHSLRALGSCNSIQAIVLILPPVRPEWVDSASNMPKVISISEAGETRQGSLANGLVCLPEPTDVVLVHDAARCLVRPQLVDSIVAGLDDSCDGVIAAIPMEDAVKEVSLDGVILGRLNRKVMWRAQTPQVFRRSVLEEALVRAEAEGLDSEDCSELVTSMGNTVKVVEGDSENIKITRRRDLILAEQILAARVASESLAR